MSGAANYVNFEKGKKILPPDGVNCKKIKQEKMKDSAHKIKAIPVSVNKRVE